MKKSDWVALRLLRKLVLKDKRAALDHDIHRTIVYLSNKYGKKHFHRCIDAIIIEEASK